MRIVTLITDFGLRDGFVGVMKGVILGRAPQCRVVDLSHEIEPGDIQSAAFVLYNAHRWFPVGTIHVAVVDPGVGGSRSALAIRTDRAWFIGPDNGVLSWAVRDQAVRSARQITNPRLFLRPVSQTFHGRDVFAPVAAHLARGGRADQIGPEVQSWKQIPWPVPDRVAGGWRGEILYLDRFGNALTNILTGDFQPEDGAPWAFVVPGRKRARFPVGRFYAGVGSGEPIAVPGSSGFWELAVNGGSAAQRFGLKPGDPVEVVRMGRAR